MNDDGHIDEIIRPPFVEVYDSRLHLYTFEVLLTLYVFKNCPSHFIGILIHVEIYLFFFSME